MFLRAPTLLLFASTPIFLEMFVPGKLPSGPPLTVPAAAAANHLLVFDLHDVFRGFHLACRSQPILHALESTKDSRAPLLDWPSFEYRIFHLQQLFSILTACCLFPCPTALPFLESSSCFAPNCFLCFISFRLSKSTMILADPKYAPCSRPSI